MKLVLYMASLQMKYLTQINGNRLLIPQTILNIDILLKCEQFY